MQLQLVTTLLLLVAVVGVSMHPADKHTRKAVKHTKAKWRSDMEPLIGQLCERYNKPAGDNSLEGVREQCARGETSIFDVLGPYYRHSMPASVDYCKNDPEAAGTTLTMSGTILDLTTCEGLEGATIEIWHADSFGDYIDSCRGYVKTNSDGFYEFETIIPGYYDIPRRPRHIHLRVSLNGTKYDREGTKTDYIGVYQVYFDGDERLGPGEDQEDQVGIVLDPPLVSDATIKRGEFSIVLDPLGVGKKNDRFDRANDLYSEATQIPTDPEACKLPSKVFSVPEGFPDAPFPQRYFYCTEDPAYLTDPIYVEGYLLREDCSPIRDVKLEFWQSNSLGVYTRLCYGYSATDLNGSFQILTIRPGTQLHIKFTHDGVDHYTSIAPGKDVPIQKITFPGGSYAEVASYNFIVSVPTPPGVH